MLETIIIAMIIAKIKGYKIKPLFRAWAIYPVFAAEIFYLFFQINIFVGNGNFIQYAPIIKKVYLFLLIIPIIVYKEYLAGIIGALFVIAGTLLNNFVMSQNGGKMPVFPKLSYITGYIKPGALENGIGIHILGTASTKWWFLSDIFDVGWSVLSAGDILIRVLVLLVFYKTIKVMNIKVSNEKNVVFK